MKKFIPIISLLTIVVSCSTSSYSLENKGYNFIKYKMMSPSSVALIKCIDANDTANMLERVGWVLEPYQNAVYYDIEASNAFGGLLTKSYIVFFVDGSPIDFLEAQQISGHTVQVCKNVLRANGFYKH